MSTDIFCRSDSSGLQYDLASSANTAQAALFQNFSEVPVDIQKCEDKFSFDAALP